MNLERMVSNIGTTKDTIRDYLDPQHSFSDLEVVTKIIAYVDTYSYKYQYYNTTIHILLD